MMLALLAAFLVEASAERAVSKVGAPAFDKVLTMLNNLITQIEQEEVADQQDYSAYQTWFTQESDTTSAAIGTLQTRLSELGAVIADLASQQSHLGGEVGRLNGEIAQEESQMQQAQQKRQEEQAAFTQEQLDFDNSIKACEKAAELLSAHYGDGKPKESTRPAWMSLISNLKVVAKVAAKHHHDAKALTQFLQRSFLQEPDYFNANGAGLHDVHQDSTGEALSIVEQVNNLAATFADDKQSSIDQENELKGAFTNLMTQKQALHAQLSAQRDQQQSALNQVNQELGENQNAEATAKSTLLDEQAYLSSITAQEADTTTNFKQRVHDRAQEKTAVSGAVAVLTQEAPALVQGRFGLVQGGRSKQVRRAQLKLKVLGCTACHQVSAQLLAASKQLSSTLLATAAMTTGSADALQPVVEQLTGLVGRIDEQQRAETEHKNWCEKELSTTANTKKTHEALVEEFTAKIEDTKAAISEKQQQIADTAQSVQDADRAFEQVDAVRKKAKQDFEQEQQDYVDSIAALNQAIDILADFYRDQALVQTSSRTAPDVTDEVARERGEDIQIHDGFDQLESEDEATEKKVRKDRDLQALVQTSQPRARQGGAHVVETLKLTREDFSAGQKSLEAQEEQQVRDHQNAKAAYEKTRADLVDAGNRFQAELQAAQLSLAQAQTDLADNQDKVQAATTYLGQVGGSCNALIENFTTRSDLRASEKVALQKAIQVLQAA